MIIKDLGAVSAYAYAVEKGYTGTEEEFATLMASYATVAEEAAESTESASQSATSASASAQIATTKASEASTSATQASASVTSASQSAQTATIKASEASASASTASSKASEASASATTASSKASEASASATNAQTAQGLAESARDDAIDAKTDAETARDMAQQYAESIDPDNIFSAYATDTASGAVATFTDGADDIPMKSVVIAIEPVQSGSGDPSPDNVRPISGWTGAQVSHSGADRTNPTTYPITFPSEAGTVYGGTLDVTNGVLAVDRAMVDLGTLTWNKNVNDWSTFYSENIKSIIRKYVGIIYTGGICSVYATDNSKITANGDNYIFYGNVAGGLRVKDTSKADLSTSEFKTAMSGIQYCFELAEPIVYHLTPTEIKSLLGDNNIWADAGDTEVTYRADTKLYIEKKMAGTDIPMIATDNIVSGSYFMIGSNLYKATANIASGAAVVVGTNAVAITMAEALNEINA